MPNNVSNMTLAIENIRLAEELQSYTSEESKQTARKCALMLRAELKKCKSPDVWPPTPENLDNDFVPIPESVTDFLRVLLTGETQNDTQAPARVQRLINSFAQDYVFAVSVGGVKLAKHILLPGAIKSLTKEMLQPYNAGKKRVGPPVLQPLELSSTEAFNYSVLKNRVWSFVRQTDTNAQKIPPWTGFNIKTRNQIIVSQDSIGYLATINAPATNMTTVNEILNRSLKIMEALNLKEIVCTFDQALFAKATEIAWKNHKRNFSHLYSGWEHSI